MSDRLFRFLPVLLLTLLLPASTLAAEPLWRTVQPTGFVTDAANLLTPEERATFEADLDQYRRETTNEISVVILPSLEGSPSEEVALEIGRRFGVGTTKDNGMVLLMALQEREIRMEVGYGLEGAVPDATAQHIIAEVMAPKFRSGAYAGGIRAGIEAVKAAARGEYARGGKQWWAPDGGETLGVWVFLIFLLYSLFRMILHLFSRTRSWWLGGVVGTGLGAVLWAVFHWSLIVIPVSAVLLLLLDLMVSRLPPHRSSGARGWWFPGGRGGSGQGGFRGFGGGSFGGGGAGGKW